MRPLALIPGLMLLAGLWALPLGALWPAFPVHMLRHMGLVAVAAPLIVLGLPRLAAHRRIYQALGDMMQTDIHALSIEMEFEE